MSDVRSIATGIVLGAVVALLVREVMQFGLAFSEWSLKGPRAGEALITGALVGAVTQLFGPSRGRR